MPKVVVYIPAKLYRETEARGFDVPKYVREVALDALRNYVDDGPFSEETTTPLDQGTVTSGEYPKGESAAESSVVAEPAVSSESRPKKRLHPCKHYVPPSKHCEYCDA